MNKKILLCIFVFSLLSTSCFYKEVGTVTHVRGFNHRVIFDCDIAWVEAFRSVPADCPQSVVNNLTLAEVYYYSFDGKIHRGQVLVDYRLADDVQQVFKTALEVRFPMYGVIPIDHSSYDWNNFFIKPSGNTYSFHYRNIVLREDKLSLHATGQAIDINPVLNPFRKWGRIFPPDGTYKPELPGTLYRGHPVVEAFENLGWKWGGDWRPGDYMHFQKPIDPSLDIQVAKNPHIVNWPFETYYDTQENRYYYSRGKKKGE